MGAAAVHPYWRGKDTRDACAVRRDLSAFPTIAVPAAYLMVKVACATLLLTTTTCTIPAMPPGTTQL